MDTKKLRQKILDLAIHGKLVPQDPNDEPASVLLERIRAEKERLIAEGKIKRSKKSSTSDTPHYENVPFEVPEGWVWVSLSEIAHSCLGKMLDKEKNQGTPLPYLRNVNVRWGAFELEDVLQMPFCEEEDERFSIVQGDLVVCEGGEPGRCAIWEHKESIKFQKALHRIRCFNGTLNYYIKSVIEWYASSKNIEKYYTGSTIKHLTGESLNTLQIPLPPIQEQHRIVSIIDQWMSLIGLLDTEFAELKQNIEKTKSRILALAIKGELVPQDENDEPASELLKRINPKAVVSCDNPHYENIPSSWVCTTMGSLFQHNTGKALNKSTSVEGTLLPYLTTSNVYWNTFDLSVVKEMRFKESEIEKCTIRKGDLLVCEGGDIGRSAIWDKDYSICIQNHLHRLRPKGDVIPLLYLYYIMYLKLTNNLEGKGIGLQGFSSGLLDKLEVPLPPYNEQIRIVDKIQEAFDTLDSIAESLN